ncbi:MAG: ABC transporter permease subunit, partial [Telmatospirillum sp.]|nr:ABC transporter permease subunit [Telmatospirillum sp.]
RWGGGAAVFGGDSPLGGVMVSVAALSFWAVGAIAEAFRAALQALPRGQFEAACSVGLGRRQAVTRILLPQAVPAALPVLCNALISLVKGSSVVFLISVVDLLNGALIRATANYRYLEAYAAAAVVYWAINATVGRVGRWLESRHAGQERGRRA